MTAPAPAPFRGAGPFLEFEALVLAVPFGALGLGLGKPALLRLAALLLFGTASAHLWNTGNTLSHFLRRSAPR